MDKPVMTIGDPDNVNISHLLMAGARSFHANTVAEAVRAAVLLLTPGL
jgi:hypothetical protein